MFSCLLFFLVNSCFKRYASFVSDLPSLFKLLHHGHVKKVHGLNTGNGVGEYIYSEVTNGFSQSFLPVCSHYTLMQLHTVHIVEGRFTWMSRECVLK
jgi:hypothetical protein